MLYEPRLEKVIDLRESLETGIIGGLYMAAIDFLAGENKPWTYYLGVGLGTMAVATGIPGAAATMYVVGDIVDFTFFKSPDGSDVRLFLNGVAATTLDTYAASAVWEVFQLSGLIPGIFNRIDIVNFAASTASGATGIAFMGLGPITVYGANAQIQEHDMQTIVFRIEDAEQDSPLASVPVNVPDGFTIAQLQTYVDAVAAEIDALTDGKIAEVSVTVPLNLPVGLKAAATAGSLNERGGLITFDTAGPRADSVRIPAFNRTIMPGDAISLTDTDVAALVTRLTTATTAANIRPVSTQNHQFTAARGGKKSLRRK